MSAQWKSRLRWFSLVILLVLIDFVSKYLANQFLQPYHSVPLIPIFAFTYACNTGAAFSLFANFNSLLTWFSLAASILFAVLIFRLPHNRFWIGLAFTGILAGAVGNLIDRAFRGCVVDFLHFYVGDLDFPIFNLADTCITLGAITWLLVHFWYKDEVNTEPKTLESEAD